MEIKVIFHVQVAIFYAVVLKYPDIAASGVV